MSVPPPSPDENCPGDNRVGENRAGENRPGENPPAQYRKARLARAALLLYPPAWRARYGEEVAALLDDTGGGLRAVAALAWHAVPAWVFPAKHLHDKDSRVRASLGTVLVAWSALVGISLVFVQLTQFQGYRPTGHPIIGWCYAVIDAAVAASALSAAAGGLPLWLLMLRRARREHRPRDTFYMLLPVIAPGSYLAALAVTTRLASHPNGLSPLLFLAVTVAGFATAAVACAGPILALGRLRPRGPAVQVAARCAGVAAGSIVIAAAASAVAAIGLGLWARDFAGYHQAAQVGGYLAVVAIAIVAATTGATRCLRATLARAGR